MQIKLKVIAALVIVGVLLTFLLVVSKLIFRPTEVAFCKTFILRNTSVQDYFGTIENIKLVRMRGSRSVFWSTDEAKTIDGVYCFLVKGTKNKGRINVHWQTIHDVIEVTRLSMRQGLMGEQILWPQSQATSVEYILPSHIWDGFISLGIAAICLLFYLGLMNRRKWAEFPFFLATRSEGMRTVTKLVCALAALTSVTESVLCFVNITTFF